MAENADARTGLDGLELQYTYEDGQEVVVTFAEGGVRFEFLRGPLTGTTYDDLPYRARVVDEQVWLVNWHNVPAGSFVTLYVDLPRERVFGSALIWYASDAPVELFDTAVITRIERAQGA